MKCHFTVIIIFIFIVTLVSILFNGGEQAIRVYKHYNQLIRHANNQLTN